MSCIAYRVSHLHILYRKSCIAYHVSHFMSRTSCIASPICKAMGGHGAPEATRGHGRPQEATGGHGKPQEATGSHKKPREDTGGHGRQREFYRFRANPADHKSGPNPPPPGGLREGPRRAPGEPQEGPGRDQEKCVFHNFITVSCKSSRP